MAEEIPLADITQFDKVCNDIHQRVCDIICPSLGIDPRHAWFEENASIELWMAIYSWFNGNVDKQRQELENVSCTS